MKHFAHFGRYGHIGPLYYRFGERWGAWIFLPKSEHKTVFLGYIAHSDWGRAEGRADEGFLFHKRVRNL
jgi:hypothetical protein